ncbi:hypothetical protein [Bacillus horti]|uniref:HTH LytTR-type domain-containing protein n=1 Tax=Caldalkalibacillus horti TaxID=77523 RepID=A0ABT9W0J5_9BACI|nr:hypothetical protein [Bacillus horti]MDQ0166758.1 hypothetical protein [Bacillus horti]
MNHKFITVKNLHGELVFYHRKGNLGTSITTKEMFFQKPNFSYHILFDDIHSMIPYDIGSQQTSIQISDELKVFSEFSNQLYKVHINEMVVLNRQGRFLRQNVEIILPLSPAFLEKVQQFSHLTSLPV